MNTIYIVALEPLDTRYTGQWFQAIPEVLTEEIQQRKIADKLRVQQIAGTIVENASTTEGAFLNFADTNIWKSEQSQKIAEKFKNGDVKAGDKFLVTDAWNPVIIQIAYMSQLLDIPVEIHSLWHAGSYDKHDFLGRKIKDKRWTYNFERSLFEASTHNYFATEFHANMFQQVLYEGQFGFDWNRVVISGQPHNLLASQLENYTGYEKEDIVLFPHRIAPEKQPEIFKDLATHIPEAKFIVCQETKLSKHEYHSLLAKSKIVFSANLQETLGISTAIEAPIVDAIPLVPDRLSYSEIFSGFPRMLYDSNWTIDWDHYLVSRVRLIDKIRYTLTNYEDIRKDLEEYRTTRWAKYGNAGPMIDNLVRV